MSRRESRSGRRRLPLLHVLAVAGVAILVSLFVAPTAASPTSPAHPPSSSGVAPYVASFPSIVSDRGLVVSSSSATSSTFTSDAGNAIVVFVSVYGQNIAGVTDASHDAFTILENRTQDTPLGYNSLWIFTADNVSARAANTFTVTLTGTSLDSAAADLVDVGGVGTLPVITLGTPSSYSTTKNSELASTVVSTTGSELVLGAVGAHETRNWNASGGDTLLNDVHASTPGAPMTGADYSQDVSAAGNAWLNATTTQATTYWMADSVALAPVASHTPYSTVTFSETGLSWTHAWYVTLGGVVNDSTTTSLAFSVLNGTYRYTVGEVSGFTSAPGNGTVTISGSSHTVKIAFRYDSDDWPTYLGDITRNSANYQETTLSSANATNLTELWRLANGYIQSEPVESKGVVYVGAYNGNEYAINASTGNRIWKTYIGQVDSPNCAGGTGAGLTSSATVTGGTVYAGGGNITGDLVNGTTGWYALNATTGAIEWSVPIGRINLGGYNWASPLLADGYAYVGNASMCDEPLVWGGVYQVNLTTHKIVNFFNTTVGDGNEIGASVWGSPTYDAGNNTVFFTTGNPLHGATSLYSEGVVAVNATTLAPLGVWQVPANQAIYDSDFGTTPDYFHLSNGTPIVVAENKNGYTYALDAKDLTAGPIWEDDITNLHNPQNVAPLAWAAGLLYDGNGPTRVGGVNYTGAVEAIYPNNGTFKWQRGMPGDVYAAPAYANGILAVTAGYTLEVLNASRGTLLWSWNCTHIFSSAPSIADGRIYAGCNGTYAFGFSGRVAAPLAPILWPGGVFGARSAALPTALFLGAPRGELLSVVSPIFLQVVEERGGTHRRNDAFPRAKISRLDASIAG